MNYRAIEVRSPAEAKDFSSSLCVQTGSGAHPASCPMGTGVLNPWVNHSRGVKLTTHPHLVPRSWMSRSYISSPPRLYTGVLGLLYLQQIYLMDTHVKIFPPCTQCNVGTTGPAENKRVEFPVLPTFDPAWFYWLLYDIPDPCLQISTLLISSRI
jgi:hypothetical protein